MLNSVATSKTSTPGGGAVHDALRGDGHAASPCVTPIANRSESVRPKNDACSDDDDDDDVGDDVVVLTDDDDQKSG